METVPVPMDGQLRRQDGPPPGAEAIDEEASDLPQHRMARFQPGDQWPTRGLDARTEPGESLEPVDLDANLSGELLQTLAFRVDAGLPAGRIITEPRGNPMQQGEAIRITVHRHQSGQFCKAPGQHCQGTARPPFRRYRGFDAAGDSSAIAITLAPAPTPRCT